MKREYMWEQIEVDSQGNVHYNQEKLALILKCLNDPNLLESIDKTLSFSLFGNGKLSEYINYFNKIKKYFNLGQNIIEIGFGMFPIISYLIDNEQRKLNCGSITAYDGSAIPYEDNSQKWKTKIAPLGNIIYNLNYLDESTILPNYDLIFGIKCCEGLFELIKVANRDHLDFFLIPCDCYSADFITNELYNLAKEGTDSNSELLIDDSISKNYPIILRRKR